MARLLASTVLGRLAPLRAALLLLLGAAAAVSLVGGGARPHATARLASGSVTVSNSRDGTAVLSAAGMRPGDSATGEVTIANTGDAAGLFTLTQTLPAEQPGTGGGRLAGALHLRVEDVTVPAAPVRVYDGALATLSQTSLGSWQPGDTRTYRLAVSLPATAANRVQGGAVTADYAWSATLDSGPTTTTTTPTTATPTGTAPTGTTPTTPVTPPRPVAPALRLSGKPRQSARKPILVLATCNRPCTVKATARVAGAKGVRTVKAQVSGAITVKLPPKAAKAVRAALAHHRRVRLAVTAVATGAGGAQSAAVKTVLLTR